MFLRRADIAGFKLGFENGGRASKKSEKYYDAWYGDPKSVQRHRIFRRYNKTA